MRIYNRHGPRADKRALVSALARRPIPPTSTRGGILGRALAGLGALLAPAPPVMHLELPVWPRTIFRPRPARRAAPLWRPAWETRPPARRIGRPPSYLTHPNMRRIIRRWPGIPPWLRLVNELLPMLVPGSAGDSDGGFEPTNPATTICCESPQTLPSFGYYMYETLRNVGLGCDDTPSCGATNQAFGSCAATNPKPIGPTTPCVSTTANRYVLILSRHIEGATCRYEVLAEWMTPCTAGQTDAVPRVLRGPTWVRPAPTEVRTITSPRPQRGPQPTPLIRVPTPWEWDYPGLDPLPAPGYVPADPRPVPWPVLPELDRPEASPGTEASQQGNEPPEQPTDGTVHPGIGHPEDDGPAPPLSRVHARPPPLTREEKLLAWRMSRALARALSAVTETLDLAQCFYDAMPKGYKRRPGNRPGRPNAAERYEAIWKYYGLLPNTAESAEAMRCALVCAATNWLEDRALGAASRRVAELSRRTGRATSYQPSRLGKDATAVEGRYDWKKEVASYLGCEK